MKHTVKFRGEMKEFDSHLTTSEAVDVCWALICSGLLADDTCEFLRDLHGRWRQYRNLTDAQQAWVHFYACSMHLKPYAERENRAWRIGQGDVKSGVHGEHGGIMGQVADDSRKAAELDGAALVAMFTRAQGIGGEIKLLCPQMFVKLGGREVKLKFCGPRTKNPGGLYLTNGETYLGKITKEGRLLPVRMLLDGLLDALREFCTDPVAYAVKFGRVTGRCCFCGLELSNRHSIFNGFGKICSEHWGLPYEQAPDDWQPGVEALGRVITDLQDGA